MPAPFNFQVLEAERLTNVAHAKLRRPQRARVLLALFDDAPAAVSLDRALTLVRELDGDLHVLRVISDLDGRDPSMPNLAWLAGGRRGCRQRGALGQTRRWLTRVLGRAAPLDHVGVQRGDFVEQVARRARAITPELIVVPPRDWQLGKTVISLAEQAGCPVLLAREQRAGKPIFAASDMHDARFRVMSRATSLGLALHTRVVTFQDIDAVAMMAGSKVVLPETLTVGMPSSESETETAHSDGAGIPVPASSELDPVRAIIEGSSACHADIVVVGTQYRSWWATACASVASGVVNRAPCSVLVTPTSDECGTADCQSASRT